MKRENRQFVARSLRCALLKALAALGMFSPTLWAQPQATPRHRVYAHLLEPREHPDYDRRAVKPPTWDTFKNRTQFTCLRGFGVQDDRLVGFAEELEKYTRTYELGEVIWPAYSTLFATNLADLADEIKRRDLYLFDIWGYVPGSGPGGYWTQFTPPASAFATLEAKLGERWLGTDIGEQDGRYIGGYANQMSPASASRFEQYLNFQRHFEKMSDDLGHKHATLVSLNFGHYFLKEGTYTLIGAETAQALPNNQVYYAFIRGAGKQYGVPWFGNASIYNRWGYKTYGAAGGSGGDTHSPTNGTSLSLLKRLLYSHILYNCVAVGFENGWLDGDKLSPIGHIQQSAQRWVKTNGPPGAMHTPVALLLDFYSGWTFPRHLYSGDVYRVWGNRPYEAGDYLTDAVLDLLYPGYQNSSYFHDESGFVAPTPFGDIADCLLSDAPQWLLARYPVVIAAGELSGGRETLEKLLKYAAAGGHLVITAGSLAKLNPANPPEGPVEFKNTREMFRGDHRIAESALQLYMLAPSPGETTLVRYGDQPAVVRRRCGKGTITSFASPFGVAASPEAGALKSEVDKPLPKPFRLLNHVRLILEDILRGQQLFETGTNLSLITCRRGPGEYTLGIANNGWHELPLKIVSRCGAIQSICELPLDQPEEGAIGQTPAGVDASKLGKSGEGKIAGGDVRLFTVKVKETGVEEMPHIAPPPRPCGRLLTLRGVTSIKEAILARPTFFEHFDGVCVDWRYLHERERATLESETGWLKRQGVRMAVDLSSGVNLYPTLRLIDNLRADYEASTNAIQDVLAKMEILGARELIISLHRHPETNFTPEQTREAFLAALKNLSGQAATRGVTLQLRVGFGKPPWSLNEALDLLEKVGATNLKLAPSTALLGGKAPTAELADRMRDHLGLWLVAAARHDAAGKLWDAHAPIHSSTNLQSLTRWLELTPAAPAVLDARLEDGDAEYLEALALEKLLPGAERTSKR